MKRMTIPVVAFSALAVCCATLVSAVEPDQPAVLAVAAPVDSGLAEPEATPPSPAKTDAPAKMYLIEAQLIGTTLDGQPSVLSSPAMMILEGKPATVQVGSQIPMPIDGADGQKKVEQVFEGLSFTAKVYCSEDGQTLLDANIARSWTLPGTGQGGLRLASSGVRLVEPVMLGNRVVVPLGQDGGQTAADRFEITVSEILEKTMASPPQNQPVQR